MATRARLLLLNPPCPRCVLQSKRPLPPCPSPSLPPTRLFSASASYYREHSFRRVRTSTRSGETPPLRSAERRPRGESHAEPLPLSAVKELSPALRRGVYIALRQIHPFKGTQHRDIPDISRHEILRKYERFCLAVRKEVNDDPNYSASTSNVPTRMRIETIEKKTGLRGLINMFRYSLASFMGIREAEVNLDTKAQAADARFPQEWYPRTRQVQRTWHLHVGPTNSGKTYHALKRLEESQDGIYAGPLRLLAGEIFERMNAKGIECNLVTGDDVRIVNPQAKVKSSTMEMVDVQSEVDVCVIDEIQMIGDSERGWAWTQALLGVKAKEVHMCGEERVVPLIKNLADVVGDKLVIHSYERLGPLKTMEVSLENDLTKIKKGDCVVTFSRRNIFALKRSIEEQTGLRCAVVYGGLPPETRNAQARLFNDQNSEYDVLVASDAVGMGLNLAIKRVVFESIDKFNGHQTVAIEIPQIKQIAGRAGRYRVAVTDDSTTNETVGPLPAAPQLGLVTTLEKTDLKAVKRALEVVVKPMQSAGLRPLTGQIERFVEQFPPSQPFSSVLAQMAELMRTNKLFHVCSFEEPIYVAKELDHIRNLSVADRMTFVQAPVGKHEETMAVLRDMAQTVADGSNVSIMNIKHIDLEVLDEENYTVNSLKRLESLHRVLIMYLWLSYRFPVQFHPRETAIELKEICEAKIQKCLGTIRFSRKKRTRRGESAREIELASEAEERAFEQPAAYEENQPTEDSLGEATAPALLENDMELKNWGEAYHSARDSVANRLAPAA